MCVVLSDLPYKRANICLDALLVFDKTKKPYVYYLKK
jgi:hypothetical protein